MTTVPKSDIGSVTQSRAPAAAYISANTTADDFGGGLAKGLQKAGSTIMEGGEKLASFAIRQAIDDNEREAKHWDTQFAQVVSSLDYGDGSTDSTGFYGTSGENTIGQREGYKKAVADARKKILGQIKSQNVQKMFETAADSREQQANERADQYTSKQRLVANEATGIARQNQAVDDAVAANGDTKILEKSLFIVRGEVQSSAQREGLGPEATKMKLEEAQTKLMTSVIGAAISNDDAKLAQSLYDRYRSLIDGRVQPEIEKALSTATTLQQSFDISEQVIAMNFPTLRDALKYAKTLTPNVKVLDQTFQRIENDFQAKRADNSYALQQQSASRERIRFHDYQEDRARDEAAVEIAATAQRAHPMDEKAALAAIETIVDPILKKEAMKQTSDLFATQRRIAETTKEKDAQAQRDNILSKPGISEAEAMQTNRDINQGVLEEETARLIEQDFRRKEHDAVLEHAGIISSASDFVAQGGSRAEWMKKHPVEAATLRGDTEAFNRIGRMEEDIAAGKDAATASDGHEYKSVLGMNYKQRAQYDYEKNKMLLNRNEQEEVLKMVEAAKDRLQKEANGDETYTRGDRALKQYFPGLMKDWADDKLSGADLAKTQAAHAGMQTFINEHGGVVTEPELNAEAIRLMLHVRADFKEGKDFDGNVAQARETLTPEEKAQVVMEYDDIPTKMKQDLISRIKQVRPGLKPSEELLGAIAGAILMNDGVRADMLLQGAR